MEMEDILVWDNKLRPSDWFRLFRLRLHLPHLPVCREVRKWMSWMKYYQMVFMNWSSFRTYIIKESDGSFHNIGNIVTSWRWSHYLSFVLFLSLIPEIHESVLTAINHPGMNQAFCGKNICCNSIPNYYKIEIALLAM